MRNLRSWAGPICRLLVLALIFLQFPVGVAKASMVSTERLLEATDVRQDRKRVLDFMAREDVRAKLVSYGVDPAEAQERVKALSGREIKMVAAEMDNLPAGQDGFGTVAAVILLVFLVLLVTDLLGATDVFPFVKKVRN
jgi:hypothetical protein